MSTYKEQFKLNNLEVMFALTTMLECDEEVARKLVELLRELRASGVLKE